MKRRGTEWATWTIIIANISLFAILIISRRVSLVSLLALHPAAIFSAQWHTSCLTLVSHLFLHVSGWHLAGNIFMLWLFAEDLEREIGPVRFLSLYFLGGIAGGLLHAMLYFSTPMATVPAFGASGGVSAVLGAYFALHAGRYITARLLLWDVDVPLAFVGLLWGISQVALGLNWAVPVGGVQIAAHSHGIAFVIGFVLQVMNRRAAIGDELAPTAYAKGVSSIDTLGTIKDQDSIRTLN